MPKISRLQEKSCGLLVIDLQEKFAPHIENWDLIVQRSTRLIRFFQLLKAAVLVTEQYPKGLGATIPEVKQVLGGCSISEKTTFSSCGTKDLMAAVKKAKCKQWVVCGIETHVCVQQTSFDLLDAGFDVFLPVDAIGSRHSLDHLVAIDRISTAGAIDTTSEALIFEALRDAKHPLFKQASALVK